MNRSDWLAERKKGIGGSDIASVFNIGYGCRRRLWYDKRDVPPDFKREETKLMRLGNALEPLFAELYAEETGRKIASHDEPFVNPRLPDLRVNVDRSVSCAERPAIGVLEIKSVGRGAFYKYKREGLPEDYILQLQHGMAVIGLTWGAFAIGCRDTGELVHWDIDRSEVLQSEILIEGPKFWAQVENGPMPEALEPDDPRCQKCDWRVTCQGNALIQIQTGEMPQMQELAPLVTEYLERKAILEQAEELVGETAEELKAKLGDHQSVYAGERKVYHRWQDGRVTWDGKAMAQELNALRESYRHAIFDEDETERINRFNHEHPPAETFKKTGKPFRSLRIF